MVWYTQQYQVQCCLTRDLLAVGFAIQETIRSTRALMAFCLTCWCTMLSFCCATLGWAEKANLCREMRKTLFLNDIALLKAKELILLIQNQMKKKESTKKGKTCKSWMYEKVVFQNHKTLITKGVHASWKTGKSWVCCGICRGIYYFQSFVLGMSLKSFLPLTNFSQSLFLYFIFSNFVLSFLSLCILSTSHVINFLFFRK